MHLRPVMRWRNSSNMRGQMKERRFKKWWGIVQSGRCKHKQSWISSRKTWTNTPCCRRDNSNVNGRRDSQINWRSLQIHRMMINVFTSWIKPYRSNSSRAESDIGSTSKTMNSNKTWNSRRWARASTQLKTTKNNSHKLVLKITSPWRAASQSQQPMNHSTQRKPIPYSHPSI